MREELVGGGQQEMQAWLAWAWPNYELRQATPAGRPSAAPPRARPFSDATSSSPPLA